MQLLSQNSDLLNQFMPTNGLDWSLFFLGGVIHLRSVFYEKISQMIMFYTSWPVTDQKACFSYI